MIEEKLKNGKEKRKNSCSSLPPINISERTLKQVLNTENAFKLCKVGVRKNKFINFDLKYSEDENATIPPQQVIKIPMMVYNKNKFSPFKSKTDKNNAPHLLLVSRVFI